MQPGQLVQGERIGLSLGVEIEVKEHERWMREALAEAARTLTAGDVPVGPWPSMTGK